MQQKPGFGLNHESFFFFHDTDVWLDVMAAVQAGRVAINRA